MHRPAVFIAAMVQSSTMQSWCTVAVAPPQRRLKAQCFLKDSFLSHIFCTHSCTTLCGRCISFMYHIVWSVYLCLSARSAPGCQLPPTRLYSFNDWQLSRLIVQGVSMYVLARQ
ncbi:hypothetical protein COO60DRAFT_1506302 [Scenedesmus sp. NREL 46B-D3]|nr:hypothetical protein COO60DRAFT_1506302 [Scenedesmus sp. NREL 46B-D3]